MKKQENYARVRLVQLNYLGQENSSTIVAEFYHINWAKPLMETWEKKVGTVKASSKLIVEVWNAKEKQFELYRTFDLSM